MTGLLRSCAAMPQPESSGSGGAGRSEGKAECLFEAESHAFGVGPRELLLPEEGTDLVKAVAAVARFEYLPRFCDLVHEGLGGGVQHGGPRPVAVISGQAGQ